MITSAMASRLGLLKTRWTLFVVTVTLILYILVYAPMPDKWSIDKYTMLLRMAYIPHYCRTVGQEEAENFIRNKTRKKRILLWTPNFRKRDWGLGLGSHSLSTCPEQRCEIVIDRCLQPISDALAFHLPVTSSYDMPSNHPPWQVWVVSTGESAAWRQPWLGSRKKLDGKFNLTATYRWDSDFYTPYFIYNEILANGTKMVSIRPKGSVIDIPKGANLKDASTFNLPEMLITSSSKTAEGILRENSRTHGIDEQFFHNLTHSTFPVSLFRPRSDPNLPDTVDIDYAANKSGLVLWYVSNCHSKRTKTRIAYAKELSKHISINIYGSCSQLGAKPDPCKKNNNCMSTMLSSHKFYLSFENARCQWYITEKFCKALNHKTIPVALGARLEDYVKVAPRDSFLHVDNFTSPKELAEYMNYLAKNDAAYNRYFEWRKHYINAYRYENRFICDLCEKLWNPGPPKAYDNFSTWFGEKENCQAYEKR